MATNTVSLDLSLILLRILIIFIKAWTNDRLWRKNRRKNAGSSCVGVDPNRNFDYGWLVLIT